MHTSRDGRPGGAPVSSREGHPKDGEGDGGAVRPAPPEAELERWKLRTVESERRYREREVVLRRLRAEIDELRADRDAWRRQAELLAVPPADPASDRRATPARAIQAAKRPLRAAWEAVPEPARRIARPLLQRVRARGTAPAPGPPPAVSPAAEPAAPQPAGPVEAPASGSRLTERVSVIIPTLDAGPEFARTLDSLGAQQGIADLEVLVVDSGSDDGTPELARSRGAAVVEIPRESFSHGGTRDRMAAASSGDVLVMMVQDAVLAGPRVLHDLSLELLSDAGLAAVSARQVPRLDCDAFGAFLMFAHARGTLAGARGSGGAWFPTLTASERRAACTVDNVCAAIRRRAWEALRFRDVAFGEDLDFGLRAVEQGWRVSVTAGATVIHSHSRDAAYHLRRFVVDRLSLVSLLGDPDADPLVEHGLEAVAGGAVALLREVQEALTSQAPAPGMVALGPYLDAVASRLEERREGMVPTGELAAMARLLEGPGAPGTAAVTDGLRAGFAALLHAPILRDFARTNPYVEREEVETFVARAAALSLGQVLGDALRDEIVDSQLAVRLRAGV